MWILTYFAFAERVNARVGCFPTLYFDTLCLLASFQLVTMYTANTIPVNAAAGKRMGAVNRLKTLDFPGELRRGKLIWCCGSVMTQCGEMNAVEERQCWLTFPRCFRQVQNCHELTMSALHFIGITRIRHVECTWSEEFVEAVTAA